MAEETKQYDLPALPPLELNIKPVEGGSVLADGFFKSPNYVPGKTGFLLSADSLSELNSGILIRGYAVQTKGSFGGDGSDGPLEITSGTTTIDCANANVVVKNYSSISITGTGKLAFSNPATDGTVIILKCLGNLTVTSSTSPAIDASGMGAAGGAGLSAGNGQNGNDATQCFGVLFDALSHKGEGGTFGAGSDEAGGVQYAPRGMYAASSAIVSMTHALFITPGSGGGSGSTSASGNGTPAGAGGRGGGGLIIECGGAYNVTSTISVAGIAGGSTASDCGGSGGGAGGMGIILYNTLTTDSGTYSYAGGAGGTNNGGNNSEVGGSGGGGYGGAGGVGLKATNGGAGGAGAAGSFVVMQNKVFG